jgi:AraC-like DNA-binding protein
MKNQDGVMETLPAVATRGNESRVLWRVPGSIGCGSFVKERLAFGLSVTVSDITVRSGMHARLTDNPDLFRLVFCLKGRSRHMNRFFKTGFDMDAGENCLYAFPDPEMVREAPAGETLRTVVIDIPENRLQPGELDGLLETGRESSRFKQEFFFRKNRNTPAVNLALEEILNCRYKGRARRLFLEAKALELIACKLDMTADRSWSGRISRADMAAVNRARDLLLSNMQSPPSIQELARVAGMSHPRLNRCFSRAFGCTVFEYLRKDRLEYCRKLVAETELSMTEIAHRAGYANSSHFSRTFSDHFGIQPSRYRKNFNT